MEDIKFRYVYSNGKEIKSFVYTIEEIEEGSRQDFIFNFYNKDYKLISRDRFTGWKNLFENDIVTAPYMKEPLPIRYSNELAKFTIGNKFNFTAIDENLRVISNTHQKALEDIDRWVENNHVTD